MSREYPDWISPGRAAEGKRIFSGTIALSRMKRLAALLVEVTGKDWGEASFEASFKYDIDKRVVSEFWVEAALPLVCQASLDVYDELVRRQSTLAVIDNDHEQQELPDDYEPVIAEKGRLAIASLVEEELLLGLPQVPRKPGLEKIEYSTGGKVRRSAEPSRKVKKNPFSDLQGMLKRD